MEIHGIEIDDFTHGYLICAIWSSTDPDYGEETATEDTEETLDRFDPYNFTKKAIETAVKNCKEFQEEAGDLLLEREYHNRHEGTLLEHAGHDFWLTHNGHGAGFWDGRYPEETGDKLARMCDKYTELNIYVTANDELDFM